MYPAAAFLYNPETFSIIISAERRPLLPHPSVITRAQSDRFRVFHLHWVPATLIIPNREAIDATNILITFGHRGKPATLLFLRHFECVTVSCQIDGISMLSVILITCYKNSILNL